MLSSKEKVNFIGKVFGTVQRTSGENVQVVCPFCKKNAEEDGEELKKQKLAIDLANHERWHCWVCGEKGGNLVPILKRFFREHLEFYKSEFGEGERFKREESHVEEIAKIELPEDYITIYEGLSRGGYYKYCFEYLVKDRGLTPRQIVRWGLGLSREGKWMGRIIMPSFDSLGNLNYLTGRDVSGKKFFKYWNTKRSKNEFIINEVALDFRQELTLVEGPFDMIKAPENTTAILGSSLNFKTSQLFAKIIKNKTPIIVALDENMLDSKIPKLVAGFEKYDISISIIDYDELDGEDIGASTEKSIKRAFDKRVKWSRSDQAIRRLHSGWKRKIL